MTARRGDIGRQAVYAAEIAAFDGTSYESIVDLQELLALAERVTAAGWWCAGDVPIVAARSDAGASSTRQRRGQAPVVRLASQQMTAATLIHELAHVLAGIDAGHGPVFRRAHLDLARAALGLEPSEWLAQAFADTGLVVGERAWPEPAWAEPSVATSDLGWAL